MSLDAINKMIDSINYDLAVGMMKNLEYVGFDPLVIADQINTNLQKVETSERADHLLKLGVAFLRFGSINTHNLSRVDQEKLLPFVKVFTHHKIVMGSLKGIKEDKSRAITLPRFAAAFPSFIAQIANKINTKVYSQRYRSDLIPSAMRIPMFPSLIPHGVDSDMEDGLMFIHMAFMLDMHLAVGEDNATMPFPDAVNKQLRFQKLSFGSPVPSEEEKLKVIKTIPFDIKNLGAVMSVLHESCPNNGCSNQLIAIQAIFKRWGMVLTNEMTAPEIRAMFQAMEM